MKKFDLEQQKIPAPYEVPEDFFNKMQDRVLARCTDEKRQSNKKIILSLAAAIVLIIGLGFIWNQQKQQQPLAQPTQLTKRTPVPLQKSKLKAEQPIAKKVKVVPVTNTQSPNEADLPQENIIPHETVAVTVEHRHAIEKPTTREVELKLKQAIDKLSPQEIAELSIAYEMDTYLNLY